MQRNIYALIEIGSNSIKFFMSTKDKIIFDENKITKLGRGLNKDNLLSKESIKKSLDVIINYYNKAIENNTTKIEVIGTMALRNAKNSDTFTKLLKEKTSLDLKIISGIEEAKLSCFAVMSSLKNLSKNLVIFDTGGGSTEFIIIKNKKIDKTFSLNIGSVVLTDKFIKDPLKKIGSKELNKLSSYIKNILNNELDNIPNNITLIGIGGTVTTIAAIKHKMKNYDSDIIHGSMIKKNEIIKQIKMISTNFEERTRIIGLQKKRADIILSGVIIVNSILEILSIDSLIVSDKGVRHGMTYKYFNE